MGLISKLLLKNYSMEDFNRDIKERIGGRPSISGVRVNEQTALRYITYYSCIRVRSESLAMLPLSVYRKRRTGKGRDEAYTHPLYDIVHAVPNGEMTSLTWRETMNGHLDASGNCYSIITTNQRGQVIDLYPWPWDQVRPRRNKETRKIEYDIYEGGVKVETLPSERVLHVPGLGYDGLVGYSTVSILREYIGLGLSVNEFIQRFYGQGMNVGSVFQTEQSMTQEAVDGLRKQLMEKGAGLANSWLPLILHSGLKFERIPMPLTDAQTLEILRLTDEQICGLMRVPPHMVANLQRSTNNNIEHQGIEYVQYSMLPVVTRFEQNMNWKLFTPAERAEGYYIKFNIDALLRGDARARAAYLNAKRQNGIINADEWRELDDENPIGGIAGTAYLVNGSMISTEAAAGQQPRQQTYGDDNQPQPPQRNGGD
jgi:HK97 family phage portal protein